MKKLIVLLFLLGFSATAEVERVESLLGYVYDESGITIQVRSGGCTDKADFDIILGRVNGLNTISFKRTRVDNCRALMPYGVLLFFSYDEIGIEPYNTFKILNYIDASKRYY